MTREIKFRAKSLDGIWEYGDLHLHCTHSHIHNLIGVKIYIDPNTVGQFTGLHDLHGKEIYEGDIIRRMCLIPEGKGKNKKMVWKPTMNDTPKEISFRVGAFGFVNFESTAYIEEEWLPLLDEDCEVIGNIHDNPELLKGGEKSSTETKSIVKIINGNGL